MEGGRLGAGAGAGAGAACGAVPLPGAAFVGVDSTSRGLGAAFAAVYEVQRTRDVLVEANTHNHTSATSSGAFEALG